MTCESHQNRRLKRLFFKPSREFVLVSMTCFWVAAFACLPPALAEGGAIDQNEWQLFTQFNLWTPDITTETTTGTEIKIGIDDIIENLDLVYMGTLGASEGKWTFLTDVIHLNIEQSNNYTLIDSPLASLDLTNLEMTAWIVTPMVSYNLVDNDRLTLDFLAGARYLHLKLETDTRERTLLSTMENSDSNSGDAWNGIVGVRGNVYLPGKWYVPYFFDVGTGDTDLTWQAFTAIAYRFDRVGLSLGYRHLEWDFDEGDAGGDLIDKLYVSGPMIGIKYWF
jgi:hypothetical protein